MQEVDWYAGPKATATLYWCRLFSGVRGKFSAKKTQTHANSLLAIWLAATSFLFCSVVVFF